MAVALGSVFQLELDQTLSLLAPTKCTFSSAQDSQEMERKREGKQGRKVSPRLGSY